MRVICLVASVITSLPMLAPLPRAIAEVPERVRLSHRVQEIISDEVVPAHRGDDSAGVIRAISPLLGSLSGPQLAELDRQLAEHGLPSAAELIVRTRLDVTRPDLVLPPPTRAEQERNRQTRGRLMIA